MTRSSVGNALLDHLGDMENALLEACFTSRYLERDTVIDEPGDRIETVFLPTGAILSVITLMEDGRGVESSTIGRESAYGVLSAFGSHNAPTGWWSRWRDPV